MTTGIYLFIVYIYWISIASRKNESLFAHRIIGLNCFQLICRNESHRITIHGHFNIHRVRLLIKFFQNLWASGKQLCFFKNIPLILLNGTSDKVIYRHKDLLNKYRFAFFNHINTKFFRIIPLMNSISYRVGYEDDSNSDRHNDSTWAAKNTLCSNGYH